MKISSTKGIAKKRKSGARWVAYQIIRQLIFSSMRRCDKVINLGKPHKFARQRLLDGPSGWNTRGSSSQCICCLNQVWLPRIRVCQLHLQWHHSASECRLTAKDAGGRSWLWLVVSLSYLTSAEVAFFPSVRHPPPPPSTPCKWITRDPSGFGAF